MAFLEDPRLRQRWNQISHNAEGVAENAAAGIWSFQHRYIEPCLTTLCSSLDSCTGVCLGGDSEERARRARERERGARRSRAEYSFDFYDDWDDDDDALAGYGYYGYNTSGAGAGNPGGDGAASGGGGILGSDWDRILAGTGAARKKNRRESGNGDVVDQPRRKRAMSYGTRGPAARRKTSVHEDPTVIPSTSTFGFLGRLPFKIGGTLRYKPSAANLQDHPGGPQNHGPADEHEPLLGSDDEDYDSDFDFLNDGGKHAKDVIHGRTPHGQSQQREGDDIYNPKTRKRSSTTGSGATSDSFRSRGDLFPSDGEGDEDAVPLDDEFTVALARVDDRSSAKTRRSSKRKGKRRAESSGGNNGREAISRSVSRTTMASVMTTTSSSNASLVMVASPLQKRASFGSMEATAEEPPSLEDLHREEEMAERAEAEDVERRRRAAAHLAAERGLGLGLGLDSQPARGGLEHSPGAGAGKGIDAPASEGDGQASQKEDGRPPGGSAGEGRKDAKEPEFYPARLPNFG